MKHPVRIVGSSAPRPNTHLRDHHRPGHEGVVGDVAVALVIRGNALSAVAKSVTAATDKRAQGGS